MGINHYQDEDTKDLDDTALAFRLAKEDETTLNALASNINTSPLVLQRIAMRWSGVEELNLVITNPSTPTKALNFLAEVGPSAVRPLAASVLKKRLSADTSQQKS